MDIIIIRLLNGLKLQPIQLLEACVSASTLSQIHFWVDRDQSPAPFPDTNLSLYYIDDPTKAPVTFRWHLFVREKILRPIK